MNFSFDKYPGGNRIKTIDGIDFKRKRVFLRLDLNVPMQNGVIQDDTRIKAVLPTIKYLLTNGARVVCVSHFGRPEGKRSDVLSLIPVATALGVMLEKEVVFAHEAKGEALKRKIEELNDASIMVLENIRFYPEEIENEFEFSQQLAHLCDIYVNDAFGTLHRKHASTYGVPELMKTRAAGFLIEKEVSSLSHIAYNPERPLISVLGGAKVSDKVGVLESLCRKSSKIIIGGAMAYTFLKAQGADVGKSFVEVDKVKLASKILQKAREFKCEIILPVDHVVASEFASVSGEVTYDRNIPNDKMAMDIGPKTIELFRSSLMGAKSVFWNGPMGVFENEAFSKGTIEMAKAIGDLDAKIKICGGGDSVSALNKAGVADKFTHVSTGGGASLEFVEGKQLPGLEILKS